MSIHVFVYGSLKKGKGNHSVLGNSVFIRDGKIKGGTMVSMGSFPGLLEGDGEIHGEIYEVTTPIMDRLDRLEGHPHFYARRKCDVGDGHQAWVYFLSETTQAQVKNSQENGHYPVVENGIW